jgi:hypothetical protein
MPRRPLILGCLIWVGATVLLRVAGGHIVPTTPAKIVVTFVASFAAMAWLARRVCRRFEIERADWPVAAVALAAPTLLLDPFSSAFFPLIFPNIRPDAAGAFGGWMLSCVAGALFGVTIGRPDRLEG